MSTGPIHPSNDHFPHQKAALKANAAIDEAVTLAAEHGHAIGYRAGYEAACASLTDVYAALGCQALTMAQLIAEVRALVRVREAARAVVDEWRRHIYSLEDVHTAIDALAAALEGK